METEKRFRDPQTNQQELTAEDWQAKVDSLEEIVCLLLMQNQAMRSQQNVSE
jgi:hypothetical protein